jgi:hypothetical protein
MGLSYDDLLDLILGIIFDSSSVFSSGSFDIIRDSRRWLIIAGQENKAFAAQRHYNSPYIPTLPQCSTADKLA